MLPDNTPLRRRMLVAIALVVLLPFAFLYTFELSVNYVLFPLLESLGYGPYHGQFYISPLFAVLLVGGGLAAQIWFGPGVVRNRIGARSMRTGEYPEIDATVTQLAQQVDIERPDVAIAYNETPNAAAVDGPTGGSILLTTGLIEQLDQDELEAVLAHEVAHLRNQDATIMTIAWLLPTITYYLAVGTAWVLYGMFRAVGSGSSSRGNGKGLAHVLIVLTVTALLTLAISAMFWAASVLVHRVLSRYREYAADQGAVAMTGNPSALANALRTIDDRMADIPDRDLRKLDGGSEALFFAPLEGRAFTDAELVSTDIFPDTHPGTADRIERIQAMAGEMA